MIPIDTEAFLDLAEYDESKGKNVKNYRFDPEHTASGYWQVTNTNWRKYAPSVGVSLADYHTADSAPRETQRDVARAMYEVEGPGPWANYNPVLAQQIGWAGGSALGFGGSLGRGGMRMLPGDFASLGSALRTSLRSSSAPRETGLPQRIRPIPMPKTEVSETPIGVRPIRVSMAQQSAPSLGAAYREALSRILGSGRRRA